MGFNNVELFVVSQVSILLNNGPVNDLDSNDSLVIDARNAFTFIVDDIIGTHNWRFATTIAELDLLEGKPPLAEFKFKLKLPADMLALNTLFITGGTSNSLTDYLIFEGGIVFANVDTLSAIYRRRSNINNFPPYFIKYLVWAMGFYLAFGVVLQLEKAKVFKIEANEQLAKSVYIETQSYPTQAIAANPFIHTEGFIGHG